MYRDQGWQRFINSERRDLAARRDGQLARLLMVVLPDESTEELQRLIEQDQLQASEGLVQLRYGEETYCKHIDQLTEDDMAPRLEAESSRLAWLTERTNRVFEDTRQRYPWRR